MGIPLLFSYLVRKYESSLTRKLSQNEQCDNFFIDYNGLIHKVISSYTEYVDDHIIFHDIFQYTIKLIELIKPTKRIFIAIDGVAPRAKMNQQRMRRFKSSLANNEHFDRNKITPGTSFMYDLSLYLTDKFKEILNVEFIFSDINEKGEGEHKIMNYIRKHIKKLENDINILNGLDCDLVMLTLSVPLKFKLLRETSNNSNYIIFDVNKFKQILQEDIENRLGYSIIQQRFIKDYIVISFLLGNDFLTNLPLLKIKGNGMLILLKCYCKLNKYNREHQYIVNLDNTLNLNLLQKFFHILGQSEIYFMTQQKINIQDEKKNYYLNCFKTNDQNYINKVGKIYIEGIQWVTEYYLNGVKDFKWYYPFYYSIYTSDFNIELFQYKKFNYKKSYTPEEQMVMVLPLKSLSESYQNIIKNNEHIHYMFPDNFQIDNRDLNIPEHARNALIPFVDDKELLKLTKKIKN